MRPPRARSEPCLTLSPVASQQLVEPAAVHPVVPGQLSDRTPFQKVRLYQIPPQLHRKTLQPRCLLCLDTCVSPGVAYLLNSHTPSDTLQVHALQAWDLGVFGVGLFTDTLQVHASQC